MRRSLLTGWSFGLLCAMAVVGNAVLLQSGRHPAPLFATRAVNEVPDISPDPALVREIQRLLATRALYGGAIDGIVGAGTRLAIRTFQRAQGLPDSGEASEALLARLTTSPDLVLAKTAPATAPASVEPAPDPRLAAVQAALSRAAYGPVNADGVFGPQTRDAIMRFQLDEGLPVTGKIDDRLVKRLKAVGALGA